MSLSSQAPPSAASPAPARSRAGRAWPTPLAWKNLTQDLRRLLLALGGIGFAVLLMFMQLGFRGALVESTVALLRVVRADLILVHEGRFMMAIPQTLARTVLVQAEGVTGVTAVYPMYLESQRATWQLLDAPGSALPVRAIAFDPTQPVFESTQRNLQAKLLEHGDTVLFDRRSKGEYGRPQPGDEALVAGNLAQIAGVFELGTDFATDATILVSDRTFSRWFAIPGINDDPLQKVDLGLVQVDSPEHLDAVQRDLQQRLPEYVRVKKLAEYVADEQDFWLHSTPIGFVFGFGVVLGFCVGLIICYQILFADVSDQLPEYATLKAMGYRSRYFVGVVLQQALWLSVLAWLPAWLLAGVMYALLAKLTGLPFDLPWLRAAEVLGLTIAMCSLSGWFALRRLIEAEPAELFR